MDVSYDKINDGICFRESDHVYFEKEHPENKYISVTTLIDSFTQDFDKDFWSAYKALEVLIPKENWAMEKKSLLSKHRIDDSLLALYNITQDDLNREQQKILDSWDEENRKSCERGTAIHSELEHGFYSKGKNCDVSKFGLGGKFECRQNYSELDLPRGVYPEYLIHKKTKDGILMLAGQVDLIIKDGNDIIIVDHKTNKEIKMKAGFNNSTKSEQKMKYPLNNLPDSNFWHYSLQLSTYAWMLQQINPDFVIKDLILNHYDHKGNNTLYHCDYLKDEVERMLVWYKKELIKKQQQARRKPIEY